ncbi:sushi, von Willebrand factor type A, EGF and pentraxin domain-containing protein 1 isoform X2 [Scyliorhinus torazame]|uniref:sushi, von Willebrand factor type A, EGF and pentraxin domain-containing protein 1 isoform X2 n=1 Tax=Scyliorhinus torazame TaxID=75743 RepID=UPI003B5B0786
MRRKLTSAWSFTVLSLYLGVLNTDFLYLHAATEPDKNLDVCSSCHVNASCTITSGRKACTCNYGFYGNGIAFCADKDECHIGAKKICGDFTTCYNTFGGYYCTCNEGYRPSNNKGYMEAFTPNDGTQCAIVDCGSPPALLNTASRPPVNTTYGSAVVYHCQAGYVGVRGNDTSICSAQGQWEGANLECEAVDCKSPPALLNTVSYRAVNTTYGSAVVYHCQAGYVGVRGNDTSICSAQGQWEGANLECEVVDCRSPPALLDTVPYPPVNTTYGSAVVYHCQVGYVGVRGNDTSICSAQGQWEGANLECTAVDCGSPPALLNTASQPRVNTTYGSAVVYHCQAGYVGVRGNDTSICSAQGQWEGANLECEAVECGPPPALQDTVQYPPGSTTYGGTAAYQCQVGYFHSRGNTTLTCSAQGRWEGANLECKVVDCGSPPALLNTASQPPVNTTYGSAVVYHCQAGYVGVRGNDTSICSAQGQWEGANLECEAVDCGSPPALLNTASQPPVNTTYGSAVVYHCQAGYVGVRGNDTSICSAQGQWEGANLECEAVDCGSPPALLNTASQPPVNTTYGSAVVYHCQAGYVGVRGNDTSICSAQGQWEGANLECEAVDCGSPPALLNTASQPPVNTTYGSAVVYHCQAGYVGVRGNDTSICSAQGQWEGANLECEAVDCGSPPALLNTASQPPVNTTYGSVVVYHCQAGYVGVRGNDTSICSAQGQWEGANLECEVVDCRSPPALLNTVSYLSVNTTYGSAVVYHCQAGYVGVRGNDTSICSAQGQWEGANLECEEIDCGIPPAIPRAELLRYYSTRRESVVRYRCRDGFYAVSGRNTSVCTEAGRWEEVTLLCKANDFILFNESCLKWRRDRFGSRSEDTYSPGTNYTVNITALTAQHSAYLQLSTAVTDPPVPAVQVMVVEQTLPPLILRRVENKNGPISFYQVVVLPLPLQHSFDCSSQTMRSFFGHRRGSEAYITAEFLALDVEDGMRFSVGDRLYYREYYNAALESGKNYSFLLKTISEWNSVKKQSCVTLAQLKGSSDSVKIMLFLGLASLGTVGFILFLCYSLVWSCTIRR